MFEKIDNKEYTKKTRFTWLKNECKDGNEVKLGRIEYGKEYRSQAIYCKVNKKQLKWYRNVQ